MNLSDVYEVQREWQKYWGVEPAADSLVEVCDNVMRTKQYLDDEISEVLTAVGGKLGKAAWKSWKADHKAADNVGLESLSAEEREELVGEVADVMIFAMNVGIHCGVGGKELLTAIREKQRVNLDRWQNGY